MGGKIESPGRADRSGLRKKDDCLLSHAVASPPGAEWRIIIAMAVEGFTGGKKPSPV
jgi:hypothetical protein